MNMKHAQYIDRPVNYTCKYNLANKICLVWPLCVLVNNCDRLGSFVGPNTLL